MSFNHEVQADSSDDEAGVSLTQFQTGSGARRRTSQQRQQGIAPIAQMDSVSGVDGIILSDDELAAPGPSALDAFRSSKRQQSTPPALARAMSSGFTSINRRAVASAAESPVEEPEFDANIAAGESDHEDEGYAEEQERRALAPMVPRAAVFEDEGVVDMTAGDDVVRRILEEREGDDGEMSYKVEFEDYHTEEIPFEELLGYENGQEALNKYTANSPSPSPSPEPVKQKPATRPLRQSNMYSIRTSRNRTLQAGFVNTFDEIDDPEEEEFTARARRGKDPKGQTQYVYEDDEQDDEGDEDESNEELGGRRSGLRTRRRSGAAGRSTRGPERRSMRHADDDSDEDSTISVFRSDLGYADRPKRKRRGDDDHSVRGKRQRVGERQSGRATRHQGAMVEADINDIFRDESDSATRAPPKPKVTGAREAFKPLPRNDDFRMRHRQECEVCGQGQNYAPLIFCQGCVSAYHKSCLGHRTNRDHLVTKVGDEDFVLQCRRCVALAKKKDPTAPDQGRCSECREHGNACRPFRPRKTPAQEQKERDENGGDDPIIEVHPDRVNNADNVLFRCNGCWRAFHFEHLPSRSDMMELDGDADAEQRFREYSRDWKCKECLSAPAKVAGLIAWKPTEEDNYDPEFAFESIDEDEKAYLVKWEGMSYFRAQWMPGAWVWGSTTVMMRRAFAKREDAQHPKMRTEDAIPEDFLRTDIVLNVKYTSIVDIQTEEVDKARIREIDKALIKYKGLGYEDAVWEAPPTPDDGDRWTDFVTAYNDWVLGRYVRQPGQAKLKKSLEKVRTQDFSTLEKKTQPDNLVGGELMKYQIEGVNWLYYKWFSQKNAILADEMGLGKTIQIIGFLATLIQDHSCWPFLIVVPNSTCPNWRREIKRWAPSLRVVAYYGSRESRDLASRFELFPEGSKDLRCHIVVTSYDAAADENCRKFFRSVPWQGMVVDEGQRLKNDKNQLYAALSAIKAPFRILLTGTPLQNNQRELFNLLQFLDDSYKAEELEQRFQDLTQEKITELHEMIRPFFLRRTKAQVLTFLPPMAQIILPVSMTIVQKKLYRTILAKNAELMKAIFATEGNVKQAERASLSNILMQLRKCLCHPFVYNKSIEERNVGVSASHRNLVDASAKLKLLEILLPKLREKRHRILIFSQFLDMLDIVEDFLDGMTMPYQRLDGSISALQKQKRIDEFNAPNSPLFAFLLSTRAGGVGINLATADTVIILDPDFNPHQDIQALSRAHRIGQRKKVLCFQLVTRTSAEERIMQIGRKKLALDEALIQKMDADEEEQTDLVDVLRHGAKELFEDSGEQDIHYDNYSVERLLDRSQIENTNAGAGADSSAEGTFSVARVWANNSNTLQADLDLGTTAEDNAPDPGVWANILRERERVAAEEAAAQAEAFGRGRRAREKVDYAGEGPEGAEGADFTPSKKRRKQKEGNESDTDFQADDSGEDEDPYTGEDQLEADKAAALNGETKRATGRKTGKTTPSSTPHKPNDSEQQLPIPSTSPAKQKASPNKKSKATSTLPKTPTRQAALATASKKTQAMVRKQPKIEGSKIVKGKKDAKKDAVDEDPEYSTKGSKKSKPKAKAKATPPKTKAKSAVSSAAAKISHKSSLEKPVRPPASAPSSPSPAPTIASNIAVAGSGPKPPVIELGEEDDEFKTVPEEASDQLAQPVEQEPKPTPQDVRAMIEALKHSKEPEHLIKEATRYLRGVKGHLVQLKKQKEAKEHAAREAEAAMAIQHVRGSMAGAGVGVWGGGI
ncbi:PHD/FYVE-zinc-finger like domain [Teratosphaeria destructans]|uniref:PHD/FYVE-zinc-finger like domain n=1 Tax=Teratosphaeria destructans TaxID=418781 RepID=A0A9W7W0J5_9PEZI|nr:PHD/FYVE-zinc-finger like domain [Teratosphaeria destructans]